MKQPVRWSNLKHIHRSPQHYRHFLELPIVPTAAMRVGGMAHKRLLHGAGAYAVYRKRRAGKEWEAFQADHMGVEILNNTEAELVAGVVEAIAQHPRAKQLLTNGRVEKRITWSVNDRHCIGTPDVVGPWLADLKVTNDASPERFYWQSRRMLWPAQLAWYYHGCGMTDEPVYIVAVESKPPHPVVVYNISEGLLELGRATWRMMFERLINCEENDIWPGYSEADVPLDAVDDELTLTIEGEEVTL